MNKFISVIVEKGGIELTPPWNSEKAQILNKKENWIIRAETKESDNTTDRELTQITFTLPNGLKWQGTVQDFMAIYAHCLSTLEYIEGTETTEGDQLDTSIKAIVAQFSISNDIISEPTLLNNIKSQLSLIQKQILKIADRKENVGAAEMLLHAETDISDSIYHLKKALELMM